MNKYRSISRKLAKDRRREKMCTRKVRFSSIEEAQGHGQYVYACPYCEGWHRSGAAHRLAAQVRKRK